jgi:hypothetical protein
MKIKVLIAAALVAAAASLAGCVSTSTVNWGDGTVSKVASVGFPGFIEPSARAVLAKRCPSAESYKLNNAAEFGPCREEPVQVVGGPGVVDEVVPGVLGIMAAHAGRSSFNITANGGEGGKAYSAANANANAQANGGNVVIKTGGKKHYPSGGDGNGGCGGNGGGGGGGAYLNGQTNGGGGGCGGGGNGGGW